MRKCPQNGYHFEMGGRYKFLTYTSLRLCTMYVDSKFHNNRLMLVAVIVMKHTHTQNAERSCKIKISNKFKFHENQSRCLTATANKTHITAAILQREGNKKSLRIRRCIFVPSTVGPTSIPNFMTIDKKHTYTHTPL